MPLEDAPADGSGEIKIAGKEVFIQVFPRRDQLLIIGAGHISITLVRFAKELDFLTIVIDPRGVFVPPIVPTFDGNNQ